MQAQILMKFSWFPTCSKQIWFQEATIWCLLNVFIVNLQKSDLFQSFLLT